MRRSSTWRNKIDVYLGGDIVRKKGHWKASFSHDFSPRLETKLAE